MIAHIIHDKSGSIKSVVFQGTELEGELEIEPGEGEDSVTAVDLSEVFPERAVDSDAEHEDSRHLLYLLARDIRSEFELDVERKTLKRLKR